MACIALVVAATGVAVAAIPDGGGVFNACYSNSTGAVRLVDKQPTDCAAGETGASWNQTGPQGLPGPSNAYVDATRNDRYTSLHRALGTVARVTVPAGSYLVASKIQTFARNRGGGDALCELDRVAGGDRRKLDEQTGNLYQITEGEIVNMGSVRVTAGGAQIRLLCSSRSGIEYRTARLQAIRVGTLTG